MCPLSAVSRSSTFQFVEIPHDAPRLPGFAPHVVVGGIAVKAQLIFAESRCHGGKVCSLQAIKQLGESWSRKGMIWSSHSESRITWCMMTEYPKPGRAKQSAHRTDNATHASGP